MGVVSKMVLNQIRESLIRKTSERLHKIMQPIAIKNIIVGMQKITYAVLTSVDLGGWYAKKNVKA